MDANMQLTMNSFRQLFPDKIFSLTFPWLLVKSLIFPWQLSNSLTFPGFPDQWSPCLRWWWRGGEWWRTSAWRVWECVTWGSSTEQTSCCMCQTGRRTDDLRCEYARESAGWSPERNAFHIPQTYTRHADTRSQQIVIFKKNYLNKLVPYGDWR